MGGTSFPSRERPPAAITCAGGRAPDRVFGKPAPDLFRHALGSLGVIADEALMIGDNPAIDIEGAARVPLRALRVNVATWELQQPVAVQ